MLKFYDSGFTFRISCFSSSVLFFSHVMHLHLVYTPKCCVLVCRVNIPIFQFCIDGSLVAYSFQSANCAVVTIRGHVCKSFSRVCTRERNCRAVLAGL